MLLRSQAAASHLCRQKQIRRLVGKAVTAQLVLAFILSRLDYYNALLEGLPRATKSYRTITTSTERGSSPSAQSPIALSRHTCIEKLHWLPVSSRINFQTLLADASDPHWSSTTVADRLRTASNHLAVVDT